MTKAVLGIIGGSGLYDLPGLENKRSAPMATPWGEPSGDLSYGEIGGMPIVFLARHGAGHRLPPSAINYRANIDALKRAGVTDLVSVSACGSFREEAPPSRRCAAAPKALPRVLRCAPRAHSAAPADRRCRSRR